MKPIIREGDFGGNEQTLAIRADDIGQGLEIMAKEGIKNLTIEGCKSL